MNIDMQKVYKELDMRIGWYAIWNNEEWVCVSTRALINRYDFRRVGSLNTGIYDYSADFQPDALLEPVDNQLVTAKWKVWESGERFGTFSPKFAIRWLRHEHIAKHTKLKITIEVEEGAEVLVNGKRVEV